MFFLLFTFQMEEEEEVVVVVVGTSAGEEVEEMVVVAEVVEMEVGVEEGVGILEEEMEVGEEEVEDEEVMLTWGPKVQC